MERKIIVFMTLAFLATSTGCIVAESTTDLTNTLPSVIDTDTVLQNIESDPTVPDYYVTTSVKVRAKLQIEPGVVIEFAPDTRLAIDGRSDGVLDARGTAEEPVIFTGREKSKGSWHGVYIDNVMASQNSLKYTIIEYGGGQEFGSGLGASNLGVGGFVGTSTIAIANSTFRHSKGYGIEAEQGSEFTTFAHNTFEDNDDYALRIGVGALAALDSTTTFIGQGSTAGVEVSGGTLSSAATWRKLKDGALISVTDDIDVKARLDLEAGLILQFGDNKGMAIDGRSGGILSAKGSAQDNIVMTRLDEVIWKGLYIDNVEASANALEHVTIEHGGFSAFEAGEKANLTIGGFVGSSTMNVTDSTFAYSAGHGISIKDGSTTNADIETVNSFIDNAGEDVQHR